MEITLRNVIDEIGIKTIEGRGMDEMEVIPIVNMWNQLLYLLLILP